MQKFFSYLLWMLCLVALQLLVFNHLHLWGYLTPVPFVFMLMMMPSDYPHWGRLLWCFSCGLLCDITTSTPGLGAASLTFLAFIHPFLLKLFCNTNNEVSIVPSFTALGTLRFIGYVVTLTGLFTLIYFLLQYVAFSDISTWLFSWLLSWLGTAVLCLLLAPYINNTKH